MTQTIDQNYVKRGRIFFEDGEWWYSRPNQKIRERIAGHAKKNTTRMFVNGMYIPKSHPLHKPGRYKSLDDAWSHQKINSVPQGEVYAITNKAWPEWVKIGCATIAEDRLNGYQHPHRFVTTRLSAPLRQPTDARLRLSCTEHWSSMLVNDATNGSRLTLTK